MCEVFFFLWLGVPFYVVILGYLFTVAPEVVVAACLFIGLMACAAFLFIVALFAIMLLLQCLCPAKQNIAMLSACDNK